MYGSLNKIEVSVCRNIRFHLQLSVVIMFDEQENKILNTEGEIKGSSRIDSARTKYFLAAPILKEITYETRSMAGLSNVSESKHH